MRRTFLTGNIGRDIEVRTSKAGNEYGTTSLGVYVSKDVTEWYTLTVSPVSLEYVKKHIGKGSKVLVEGTVSAFIGKDGDTPVAKLSILADKIELMAKPKDVEEF